MTPFDLEVRRRRLGNGLSVSVAPLPHLHTVTLVAGVRVGSRHEGPTESGLSHFLEHMLFRGTAEHPTAHAYNLAVESLGGTLHAATRADFTTYELTLPPEHAAAGLALLSEIFGRPSLLHLPLEKRIVREEILEGLDEDGQDVDPDDLAHRALFGTHPLGAKICGTEENLDRFDEDLLRAWHATHYVGRNTSLAVAGAVEVGALDATIDAHFGTIRAGERQAPAPLTRPVRGPRLSHVDAPGSQTEVRIVLPGPGHHDPRLVPADLLARVLDDGMSTRLFRTIVEDLGLAYEVFGGFDAYEDVGLFEIGAAIEHAKTPALVEAALGLLRGLREGPIEEAELDKARTRALFELRATLDRDAELAEHLAFEDLFDRALDLPSLARRIEAARVDDLADAAQAILRPEHLHVVAVGARSDALERETRRRVQAFR